MLFPIVRQDILRLAQIVREQTGNVVQEKNYSMLESRIRTHVLKLGMSSMAEYWSHFEANEASEREVVQGLMTTHYTFFFREFAHFEVLGKWIDEGIDGLKKRGGPLRVWSAACSRGQEVYSLAMFLESALTKKYGVPYEIVGTDIDPESVAFSKNGVYPIKEVNTIPQAYLHGNWKRGTGPVKEFAAVHPSLKNKTRFEPLNLFELAKWSPKPFDVVFCRNVFIYFSAENVKTVALNIAEHLNPGGLFVSGMSEPIRFVEWKLDLIGPSCYQKPGPSQKVEEVKKAAAERKISPSAPVAASPETQKYRVLCVDDSPTIQMLIKKIFAQDPGCASVDVANNGREARSKLDSGKYDVITLDIHMPEVTGIEFLERLYNLKSDPPVLMVSSVSRTDVELATKAISLGAFDYVEKPAMNNLQKSAQEILTKAKMALRMRSSVEPMKVSSFDESIAQKIVVPDASQCLRVVFASHKSKPKLEQVIRGQAAEYRSPATLIFWADKEFGTLEGDLLTWTPRQLAVVRDAKTAMRPNQVYLANFEAFASMLAGHNFKSVSAQVLDKGYRFTEIKKPQAFQILVDESIADEVSLIERALGPVSDITPCTSFPSLSVEFFANIRKAAA